ncbi:MAG: hypothetical protein JO043_10120 [Candidatus Eremiobacteraeota bacterium]|nr:hypothetical protein [Candidatus Eremiobacteraeota bacterium]
MKPRAFFFVPLVLCGITPLQGAASEHVPPLVHRAIARYAAEHRGELGFSRHLTFRLHAGPLIHDVSNEIGVLMRDGAFVKVRYYSATTNGKPDDAAELRRQEDRANADLGEGHGFFKRPIDPRYVADYRFEWAPCADCSAGQQAFAFSSVVHDEQHGHGIVVIDSSGAHVERLSYALDRAPDHASSADVVETFGEALPGLWTCLRVQETYHGHLGLISGTATLSYSLEHFHRFTDLESADAALTERSL